MAMAPFIDFLKQIWRQYKRNNIIMETMHMLKEEKTLAPDAIPLFEPNIHMKPAAKRQKCFPLQNRCQTNASRPALEQV